MSNTTRSSVANLLVEGIKLNFGTGYDRYDKTFLKIFDYVKSEKETEQYQELAGFGVHTEKQEGATASLEAISQSYKTYIENKAYAKRYNVSHELLSDNRYPQALQEALDLGFSAANTMEVVAIDRLNTAFSTDSADVLADGVAMCSASHPSVGGGTQSNLAGTAAALSETSLTAAITGIAGFEDPRGNKIQAKGRLLIVPKDTDVTAQKLLFSTLTVGSANNDLNPFGRTNGRIPDGYVSVPNMTDTNAFFIRTNVRGLVFQEREKPRIMEDFKNAQMTKEMVSYLRFGVNCYDFRSIYGNAGA